MAALEPGDLRAYAAKTAGGLHLHYHTASLPLDLFVLFTSVTALGIPYAGGYATGNQTLDTLALWRRNEGLPATSVQWGPWTETGMVAAPSHAVVVQAAQLSGFLGLDTESGILAVPFRVKGDPSPCVCVCVC